MRKVINKAPGSKPEYPVTKAVQPAPSFQLLDVDTFSSRYTFLLYGDNGTGKTWIGKTAPKPLFITIGTETRGVVSARGVGAKFVQISSWGQLEDVYWWLAEQDPIPFDSIVIDTVSAMQNLCITRLLKVEAVKSKLPAPGDLTLEVFPAYMSQRHYGMLASAMMDMLVRFHELKCHLVMLAQKRDEQDDSGRVVHTDPALSPGVAATACNIANVIGYTYCKQAKDKEQAGWFTYLAPHDKFKTKNQGAVLPGVVQDFSVSDAIKLIEKSGKGR